MIASIEIVFWEDAFFSRIVAAVQNAGWVFDDGLIIHDHWIAPDDVGFYRQVNQESEWDVVSAQLHKWLEQGENVSVALSLQGIEGTFWLKSCKELVVVFDGPRPQLGNCYGYADFNWMVQSIVCPLEEAGLIVAEVRCIENRA